MNTADATLEETADGAGTIRFERRYPHPVDRVWAALTEPEQLARWWLPFEDVEIDVDLVEGGAFEMRRTGDEPWSMTSTILRLDPPRLLEYTHADPGSFIRWELEPDGDGSRLVVTNGVPSAAKATENHYPAGLHTSLERLDSLLAGRPEPWSWPRFEEHRDRYAAGRGA